MADQQQPEEQAVEAQTAVVDVVDAGPQEVLHQVRFTMEVDGTMQEQQVHISLKVLYCLLQITIGTKHTRLSFPEIVWLHLLMHLAGDGFACNFHPTC